MTDDTPPGLITGIPDFEEPERVKVRSTFASKPDQDPHGMGAKATAMGRHLPPTTPNLANHEARFIHGSSITAALPKEVAETGVPQQVKLNLGTPSRPVELSLAVRASSYTDLAQMEYPTVMLYPGIPIGLVTLKVGDQEVVIDPGSSAKQAYPPRTLQDQGTLSPEAVSAIRKKLSANGRKLLTEVLEDVAANEARELSKYDEATKRRREVDESPFELTIGRGTNPATNRSCLVVSLNTNGTAKIDGILKSNKEKGNSTLQEVEEGTEKVYLPVNQESLQEISRKHLQVVFDRSTGQVTITDTSTNGTQITNNLNAS